MIFGQAPDQRIPFQRPPEASYYTPRIPSTAFYSHIHPFMKVYPQMAALQTHVNAGSRADMSPGVNRVEDPRRTGVRQAMPVVIAPPPPTPVEPGGPGPAPMMPNGGAPVSGFGNAFGHLAFGAGANGNSNGNGHPMSAGGSPYRIMRSGMFPGVRANVSNPRHGAYSVGSQIRSQMPTGYPGVSVPGGGYAGG